MALVQSQSIVIREAFGFTVDVVHLAPNLQDEATVLRKCKLGKVIDDAHERAAILIPPAPAHTAVDGGKDHCPAE